MNVSMFVLCVFGLLCSLDSAYYYYHKGRKNSLSVIIVFFILELCDKIADFIKEIKKRCAR